MSQKSKDRIEFSSSSEGKVRTSPTEQANPETKNQELFQNVIELMKTLFTKYEETFIDQEEKILKLMNGIEDQGTLYSQNFTDQENFSKTFI